MNHIVQSSNITLAAVNYGQDPFLSAIINDPNTHYNYSLASVPDQHRNNH